MFKFSYLNKVEKKAIKEFKKLLKDELREQFLFIKLFGSKARGDFHKDSDIDLIVVLEASDEKIKDKIFDKVMEILNRYEVYLSIHIYSKKEYEYLNNIPTVFMQLVQRDSINI